MAIAQRKFRCVIHGSFRKHFAEIARVHRLFTAAGIEVLAPEHSEIIAVKDGFAILESDRSADPRMTELLYLHNLKRLAAAGFSYFVDPEGYIGKSASYELGIAQISNIRCFFSEPPQDHPGYFHGRSVWKPELLAEYIATHGALPAPVVRPNEQAIQRLWENLMVPGSIISVGGIVEHMDHARDRKEILLVKTHKWSGRYSVVGGKVRRNERLNEALVREVKEETGLDARIGDHLCTFDQIKDSGYYIPGVQHVFVDKVIHVASRNVTLNEEAQEFVWLPAATALRDLDIEPNARQTVELYVGLR
jgi:ADP-ribose pyrophosphatase YjhB (NUDIX family)